MYCPQCGYPSKPDQKFCNKCGMNVEWVTTGLAGDPPAERKETPFEELPRTTIVFTILAILMGFAGVSLTIIGAMVMDAEIVIAAGVIAIMLGLVLYGMGFLLPPLFASRSGSKTRPEGAEKQAPDTAKQLPASQAEPLSVTEGTTRQLEEERVRVPRRTPSGDVAS